MKEAKNHHIIASCIISGIALFLCTFMMHAQTVAVTDGYATQNGGTTGGGSATPNTVTTASAFKSAVGNNNPAVIIVQGKLNVGEVSIGSNKTIIGADASSGLYGGVVQVRGTNNIFQNLIIGPSGGGDDGMELSGATNVFITKCDFYDGSDGSLDIVRQTDYVTVSWCKFYYVDQTSHKNTTLIGNSDDATDDAGKLHVTMHHNWYAEGCKERMPRVRYGHVHLYNNYYNSVDNNYCIGIGVYCHIRVENSYFDNINEPWKDWGGSSNGELGWSGLKFVDCSQPTFMPNAYPVFTPPYSFTMNPVDDVKNIVTSCAGNTFNDCTDSSLYLTYYSLTTSVSGQGTVSPGSGSYPADSTITLTATAEPGWKFDNWSGDLSGTDNPASLTVNSNVSVTANFSQDPTQINTQTSSACRFYPNPVNDKLEIELHDEFLQGAAIRLFDNSGRLILNKKVQGSKHILDMGNLSPGIYLIMVSNINEETVIERIAKQ